MTQMVLLSMSVRVNDTIRDIHHHCCCCCAKRDGFLGFFLLLCMIEKIWMVVMHTREKEERVVVMHARGVRLTTPNCISYPSLVSPKGISIIPASIKHESDYRREECKQRKKKQGEEKYHAKVGLASIRTKKEKK